MGRNKAVFKSSNSPRKVNLKTSNSAKVREKQYKVDCDRNFLPVRIINA